MQTHDGGEANGRRIAAIVLAAGAASRFGDDKLLARLADGRRLGEAAIAALRPSVEHICVVTAADRPLRMAMYTALPGVRVALCADARLGMGYSLASGVAAMPHFGAYLITLADMPWIQAATVAALVESWRGSPDCAVVMPRYRGRAGHPVLFDGTLQDELSCLRGDQGARAVVERYRHRVRYVDVDDIGVIRDVDIPRDLLEA